MASAGYKELEPQRFNISSHAVQAAQASIPSTISVTDRTQKPAFELSTNKRESVFGVGVTNTHFRDPARGSIRELELDDVRACVHLTDKLDAYSLLSTPAVLNGPDSLRNELEVAMAMFTGTSKPLMLLINEPSVFEAVIKTYAHFTNQATRERSDLLCYLNPITPLVVNEDTCRKIEISIEYDVPLVYSNYGMSAASTPLDTLGTLALLNAELLAGLVIIQTLKPGQPALFGSLPATFEMQQMRSVYTSETLWLNLACSEMMEHYGLLHCGTSGSGIGFGPDLPNAISQLMNHLTGALGKAQLMPFIGGDFDSRVLSPETIVLADDIIHQLRSFQSQSLERAPEDILGEIRTVGAGGSFLATPFTLEHFEDRIRNPRSLWPDLTLENWEVAGSPGADMLLKERTMALMEATDETEEDWESANQLIDKLIDELRA